CTICMRTTLPDRKKSGSKLTPTHCNAIRKCYKTALRGCLNSRETWRGGVRNWWLLDKHPCRFQHLQNWRRWIEHFVPTWRRRSPCSASARKTLKGLTHRCLHALISPPTSHHCRRKFSQFRGGNMSAVAAGLARIAHRPALAERPTLPTISRSM